MMQRNPITGMPTNVSVVFRADPFFFARPGAKRIRRWMPLGIPIMLPGRRSLMFTRGAGPGNPTVVATVFTPRRERIDRELAYGSTLRVDDLDITTRAMAPNGDLLTDFVFPCPAAPAGDPNRQQQQ